MMIDEKKIEEILNEDDGYDAIINTFRPFITYGLMCENMTYEKAQAATDRFLEISAETRSQIIKKACLEWIPNGMSKEEFAENVRVIVGLNMSEMASMIKRDQYLMLKVCIEDTLSGETLDNLVKSYERLKASEEEEEGG